MTQDYKARYNKCIEDTVIILSNKLVGEFDSFSSIGLTLRDLRIEILNKAYSNIKD